MGRWLNQYPDLEGGSAAVIRAARRAGRIDHVMPDAWPDPQEPTPEATRQS